MCKFCVHNQDEAILNAFVAKLPSGNQVDKEAYPKLYECINSLTDEWVKLSRPTYLAALAFHEAEAKRLREKLGVEK